MGIQTTRRGVLLGFAGLGSALHASTIRAGRSAIEVAIGDGELDLPRQALLDWIDRAVRAVTSFYGRFPVAEAKVEVSVVEGRGSVFNGVTYGRVPATLTRISVGQHITNEKLARDWVATHELVHLAFPSVPRRNHWIEEGLSTYVEPLARLHLRQISQDVFWRDMIRDMPQGQPGYGDKGLDNTHTWGRTYWGGAIFCLACDVAIRERTKNRRGLQDALRGILLKAGSIQVDMEVDDVLRAGDQATGTSVLMDWYTRMKDRPEPVDLDGLWRDLGVSWLEGTIAYDEKAKLASIRHAIVRPG